MSKKHNSSDNKREPTKKIKKYLAHRIIDIYREGGGRHVDLTKIERRDPNRRKKILALVIFILIFLLCLSLAGLFIFSKQGKKFSDKDINLTISTQTQIASGEEVVYKIKISNQGKVALGKAELAVLWPEGWHYQSSSYEPINEAKNAWSVGYLKSKSSTEIEIKGQIVGEVGANKILSATLSYTPVNFNSEFQKKASFMSVIASSIIVLDIEAPVRVVSGKETEYKIKYKNNSEATLEKLRASIYFPDGFVVNSVEPKPKENNNLWEIDKLESKKEGEIKILGVLTGSEGEMKELKVEMGYLDAEDNFHLQIEKSVLVLIINPQLNLTLAINDSENNGTADFGQNLDYLIKFQNESEIEIQDLSISCEIISEIADWESLIDSHQGEVKDNIITWDKQKISQLTSLKAGESGEIDFKIRVKSNLMPKSENDKNYSLISRAKGKSEKVTDLEGTVLEVESNAITTKINTRLDLITEARYYNDEYIQVGSGPIPPQAGQTTTYRIYWYLNNMANEVKEVKVKATLPEEAHWTGKSSVSAGNNLAFDPNTREVVWEINRIPPHTGQLFAGLEANFELSVTPNGDDVGKLLILTNKAEVQALDDYTSMTINKSAEMITSELTNDPQAKGKGIVVVGPDTNINLNINGT